MQTETNCKASFLANPVFKDETNKNQLKNRKKKLK
jgi:hypothetical protein